MDTKGGENEELAFTAPKLKVQDYDTKFKNYKGDFRKQDKHVFRAKKGLSRKTVEEISAFKKEPVWMRKLRIKALEIFMEKPLPSFGVDLRNFNFDDIYYYVRPIDKKATSWDELPEEIRDTYEKIGIPEAEKKFLGGVSAQYESEVVYKSIKKTLEEKGVVFLDMETGLLKYPDLVKEYFGTIVPYTDNKFASLNSAVWSGGSFIYVPKGVKVELPLQAYFRINAARIGQFERTLIIADEGSFVHYVEGCTAPLYTSFSLHSAVVEVVVKKGARVRYTTIQNWSSNVYNLVTKRMKLEEKAIGEWVDGNIGSRTTMKYPSIILAGKGAKAEVLSLSYARGKQHQDTGAKIIHMAPYTSSKVTAKSVSLGGGRASFRGLVQVGRDAEGSKAKVVCDALLLDGDSRSDTYPTMNIRNRDVQIEHEATVSRIDEDQLFYLQCRGLSEEEAETMIVNGFIEPIVKELPLEYAVELNRLIQLSMQNSIA